MQQYRWTLVSENAGHKGTHIEWWRDAILLQAGEAGDHLQSPRASYAADAGAEVRGPLS